MIFQVVQPKLVYSAYSPTGLQRLGGELDIYRTPRIAVGDDVHELQRRKGPWDRCIIIAFLMDTDR